MRTPAKALTNNLFAYIVTSLLFFFLTFLSLYNLHAQPTLFFKPIIQKLDRPIDITNANDGSGRLFIAQETGLIRIYKNGELLPKPFLDLTGYAEQSIMSIAFHPDYKKNRAFYIYFNDFKGTVTLSFYRASKKNPDSALLSSGKILFTYKSPSGNNNHNTGNLHFGKDGYLYMSIGDGDGQGDSSNQSQNGLLFSGKMLRLNVDESKPPYYSIPPDNPFVNDPAVLDEIWSLGYRNPWRWSFDRKNGDMWVGDVGQDSTEEVDYARHKQSSGANYGWRCYEGNESFNSENCSKKSNYIFPVFTYHHDNGVLGNSITGGFVYRGSTFKKLIGNYICVDYISADAWLIKSDESGGWLVNKQSGNIPKNIVGFGEDENAELYAVSFDSTVYQVQTADMIAERSEKTETKITGSKQLNSSVYPTLVTNGYIIVNAKEAYKYARLINLSGQELLRKNINNQLGQFTLTFPKLVPGIYIIELLGNATLQQKIYVTR